MLVLIEEVRVAFDLSVDTLDVLSVGALFDKTLHFFLHLIQLSLEGASFDVASELGDDGFEAGDFWA